MIFVQTSFLPCTDAVFACVGIQKMLKTGLKKRAPFKVARSGDTDLFPELEIPRPTVLEWIRLGIKEVITHPNRR